MASKQAFFIGNDLFGRIEGNPTLFRYITFEKFKSLIEDSALFFTRVDQYKDHALEGNWPDKDKQFLKSIDLRVEPVPRKEYAAVSCWSITNKENRAMWDAFSKKSDGVLVITSHDRLRDSIESCKEAEAFLFRPKKAEYKFDKLDSGEVSYICHKTSQQITRKKVADGEIWHIDGPLPYKLIKNRYDFQKEYRILARFHEKKVRFKSHPELCYYEPLPCPGFKLPVNLDILIEEIRFHPDANVSDKLRINELLNGTSFRVNHSELRD